MKAKEKVPVLARLESTCSDLKILLKNSKELSQSVEKTDINLNNFEDTLSNYSRVATKGLDASIIRVISPALFLLENFKITESLLRKLINLSSKLSKENSPQTRLQHLKKYINCVNKLNLAIKSTSQDSEPAIQKLQEVVDILSRKRSTDKCQIHHLRETLTTLKALYENVVDDMRFDGLLDEAFFNLQDEFEGILLGLKHPNIGEKAEDDDIVEYYLGSDLEVDVLRQISETLAANDFLDICVDIFVKVRYKRAAKALMRLKPDYLSTYSPEEIDKMKWESLETSITLWIKHFQLAVRTVLVSEKNLSNEVLGNVLDGSIWHQCFVRIADKIMAVFFRFGEGVARSKEEPKKLFKLLEMFESLNNLEVGFMEVFEGETRTDMCIRYKELEKLLINTISTVFLKFGLQIEDNPDDTPPLPDGSIPKQVRYAINYLKVLTTDTYAISMEKVLKVEKVERRRTLSKPETEENLLNEAVANMMEALQRNVEAKRSHYIKDKVISHVISMNTNWYIYMRMKTSNLGKLLGEQYIKKRYKLVAEESAYQYQRLAWGPLVKLLKQDGDGNRAINNEEIGTLARNKLDAFMNGLNIMAQKHRCSYIIPDPDLREQIRETTVNFVGPAYNKFVKKCASVLNLNSYLSPSEMEGVVAQMFGVTGRKNWKDRAEERHSEPVQRPLRTKDCRRSKSSSDGYDH